MKWYVVKNGVIVETVDNEEEAIGMIMEDESGELEYYPETALVR